MMEQCLSNGDLCVCLADRSWEPEYKAAIIWNSIVRKQVVAGCTSPSSTLRSPARRPTTTSSTEGWQCSARLCGNGTRGRTGSTTCPTSYSPRGMLYASIKLLVVCYVLGKVILWVCVLILSVYGCCWLRCCWLSISKS